MVETGTFNIYPSKAEKSFKNQILMQNTREHNECASFQFNGCAESDCHIGFCHHLSIFDHLLLIEYAAYINEFDVNEDQAPSDPFLDKIKRPPKFS